MLSVKAALKNCAASLLRILGITLFIREAVQKRRASIIIYHDPDPNVFKAHMECLSKEYSFVSLNELVQAIYEKDWSNLPDKALVITIDDGIKRNYRLLPVFKEYGITPTVYVCSHVVGTQRKYWNQAGFENHHPLKKLENKRRLEILKTSIDYEPEREYSERQALNWEEIREMSPYVDFQSHSKFHPILINCTDEECREEIEGSKALLEQVLKKPVEHFCYPNGDYAEREVELVSNAGYKSSRSVDVGWNSMKTDPFRLKAYYVSDDATISMLKVQATGIWNYLRHVRNGRLDGTHPPFI
jgi:peptidoglycan/xylan/chitin deacetylase (PgdA/CDA1 family)